MSRFIKVHHFFASLHGTQGRNLVAVEVEIKDRRAQVLQGLREPMKAQVKEPFAYLPREEVVESPTDALRRELNRSTNRIAELNDALEREKAVLDSLQEKVDKAKAGALAPDLLLKEMS